jgi:hypothetical protein
MFGQNHWYVKDFLQDILTSRAPRTVTCQSQERCKANRVLFLEPENDYTLKILIFTISSILFHTFSFCSEFRTDRKGWFATVRFGL